MNIIKNKAPFQAHQRAPTYVHENGTNSIQAKIQATDRAVTCPFLPLGKEVQKNVTKNNIKGKGGTFS